MPAGACPEPGGPLQRTLLLEVPHTPRSRVSSPVHRAGRKCGQLRALGAALCKKQECEKRARRHGPSSDGSEVYSARVAHPDNPLSNTALPGFLPSLPSPLPYLLSKITSQINGSLQILDSGSAYGEAVRVGSWLGFCGRLAPRTPARLLLWTPGLSFHSPLQAGVGPGMCAPLSTPIDLKCGGTAPQLPLPWLSTGPVRPHTHKSLPWLGAVLQIMKDPTKEPSQRPWGLTVQHTCGETEAS